MQKKIHHLSEAIVTFSEPNIIVNRCNWYTVLHSFYILNYSKLKKNHIFLNFFSV